MSTGPVGPADGAGQHNATRLRQTCSADGRILQPEKPLTPIDATFQAVLNGSGGSGVRSVPAAAIWGTFSGAKAPATGFAQLTYHILAVDAEPQLELLRGDIYKPLAATFSKHGGDSGQGVPWPGEALMIRDWHKSSACVDGADALHSGCLSGFVPESSSATQVVHALDGGSSGPPTPTGVARKLQLLTITPVPHNGSAWVLLGELSKFVTVASARFERLTIGQGGISGTIRGGANEIVHVVALQPNAPNWPDRGWTVRSGNATLGASGQCDLSINVLGVFCDA